MSARSEYAVVTVALTIMFVAKLAILGASPFGWFFVAMWAFVLFAFLRSRRG